MQPLGFTTTRKTTHTTLKLLRLQSKAITTTISCRRRAAAAAIAIVSTVSCCCRGAAADSNAILARLAYLVQQQAWLKIDDYVVQCESRTNKREKHFAHFTTNQSFLLPTSWLVPLVPHYWLLPLPLCHKPVGVANMILSVTSVLKVQVSALISNCLSK